MELRVQIELQVLFPVWKSPAKLFKYFLSVPKLPTWCNLRLENRGKDVQGDHKHRDKGKRLCVKYVAWNSEIFSSVTVSCRFKTN